MHLAAHQVILEIPALSAASIVYAYLRFEQRALSVVPDVQTRTRMARRALLYTTYNLITTAALGFAGFLPRLIFIPYAFWR